MVKYSKYLAVILLILTCKNGMAQGAPSGVVQTITTMYKNYDSVPFLSFDVNFTYSSDTLFGKHVNEQLKGTYTMAGKRAKYSLGDIDFMQNDSFFIAVYNRDKLMLVDEPKVNNIGSQLPMRQMMDSLVNNYASHYTITDSTVSVDTGMINFVRADSTAQFDKFSITYDQRNKMLYGISYEYTDVAVPDTIPVFSPVNPTQKRRLTIQFSNYRFDNYDDAAYSENNYIYFENGVCKPVARYGDFKIYNSKPVLNYRQDAQ